jgi:hypothetical protein
LNSGGVQDYTAAEENMEKRFFLPIKTYKTKKNTNMTHRTRYEQRLGSQVHAEKIDY